MIKGKLVVVSNLTTFKTIQQSSDPIPDSAIVFIKNEGQIWTKGSYFGVQKTYDVVSKTDAGLAPKGGDSASSLIANVDDEWVLTVTNGANPSWRKLPANAFKNQTYTFYNLAFKNSSGTTVDTYKPSTSPSKSVKAGTNVKISASSNTITISATDTTYNAFTGASDSVDGSLGLVPKPTKGNQSKFLKADGSWATPTDTTYPIVSSTKDGLVPKFDANDGTIDQLDKDWVLTNNNGSIGWYKLPTNAFNNSTYSLVNNSSNGLVPILPTTNSTTISTQADEWVLTTTKGGEPSWRKLPTTAFYSLPTAKTNALGGIKVGSVSTSAFANLTGKYYTVNVDKNGVAYVNVPWTDTPYTLPTASSTLGGVKTTSTVSSTTGLTACPIIDGVVYYKDSNSNTWRGIYVGGTSKMGTANNTKALNFAAGNNVTISYAAPGTASGQSGNASYGTLTINATNTWTAWKGATSSANGTAGYMPAPTSALRNQFLRGDGTWQSLNNYSLPTASSSTLGGVKTGAAITDTTGYTPVHIKDGVIYYKGSSTGYLPLGGGLMSEGGYIAFSNPASTSITDSTAFAITYGKIQAAAPISIIADTDGTATECIIMTSGYTAKDATKANGLAVGKNELLWKNSTILTASNAASALNGTYVNREGDTMTGPLTLPAQGLIINSSGGDNNKRVIRAYGGGIANADGTYSYFINMGHEAKAGCVGEFAYHYKSSTDLTSNYTALGTWGFSGLEVYHNSLTKIKAPINNPLHVINTATSGGVESTTAYYMQDTFKSCVGWNSTYGTMLYSNASGGWNINITDSTAGNIRFSKGNTHYGIWSAKNLPSVWGLTIGNGAITGDLTGVGSIIRTAAGAVNSDASGNLVWKSDATDANSFNIMTNSSTRLFTVLKSGNVGIGESNPSFKLTVNGAVRALHGYVALTNHGTLLSLGAYSRTRVITTGWSASEGDFTTIYIPGGSNSNDAYLKIKQYDLIYNGNTVIHSGNWSNYISVSGGGGNYLPLSGGTLTGSVTFANGTWNVVGDDAAIGDVNQAGMLGLKSCNNNIPCIGFHNSSNTLLGTLSCNAGTLTWNHTFNCVALQINGSTLTFVT